MSNNVNRYARLINRGNVVMVRDNPLAEEREVVVREVDIMLRLADGTDLIVPADDQIELVDPGFPEDFEAQLQAAREEATRAIPPPPRPEPIPDQPAV